MVTKRNPLSLPTYCLLNSALFTRLRVKGAEVLLFERTETFSANFFTSILVLR